MYEKFFDMLHTPFTNSIPTSSLYLSDSVREGLGRLCYTAENQLFAVVTATVGCGKTTLIRRLKDSLDPEKYVVLYLSDSQLTPRWFYNGLLQQLGAEPKFYRGDAKLSLNGVEKGFKMYHVPGVQQCAVNVKQVGVAAPPVEGRSAFDGVRAGITSAGLRLVHRHPTECARPP